MSENAVSNGEPIGTSTSATSEDDEVEILKVVTPNPNRKSSRTIAIKKEKADNNEAMDETMNDSRKRALTTEDQPSSSSSSSPCLVPSKRIKQEEPDDYEDRVASASRQPAFPVLTQLLTITPPVLIPANRPGYSLVVPVATITRLAAQIPSSTNLFLAHRSVLDPRITTHKTTADFGHPGPSTAVVVVNGRVEEDVAPVVDPRTPSEDRRPSSDSTSTHVPVQVKKETVDQALSPQETPGTPSSHPPSASDSTSTVPSTSSSSAKASSNPHVQVKKEVGEEQGAPERPPEDIGTPGMSPSLAPAAPIPAAGQCISIQVKKEISEGRTCSVSATGPAPKVHLVKKELFDKRNERLANSGATVPMPTVIQVKTEVGVDEGSDAPASSQAVIEPPCAPLVLLPSHFGSRSTVPSPTVPSIASSESAVPSTSSSVSTVTLSSGTISTVVQSPAVIQVKKEVECSEEQDDLASSHVPTTDPPDVPHPSTSGSITGAPSASSSASTVSSTVPPTVPSISGSASTAFHSPAIVQVKKEVSGSEEQEEPLDKTQLFESFGQFFREEHPHLLDQQEGGSQDKNNREQDDDSQPPLPPADPTLVDDTDEAAKDLEESTIPSIGDAADLEEAVTPPATSPSRGEDTLEDAASTALQGNVDTSDPSDALVLSTSGISSSSIPSVPCPSIQGKLLEPIDETLPSGEAQESAEQPLEEIEESTTTGTRLSTLMSTPSCSVEEMVAPYIPAPSQFVAELFDLLDKEEEECTDEPEKSLESSEVVEGEEKKEEEEANDAAPILDKRMTDDEASPSEEAHSEVVEEEEEEKVGDEKEGEDNDVAQILDKRMTDDGQVEYLVKWECFDEITWENARNLTSCADLIQEFEQRISEAKEEAMVIDEKPALKRRSTRLKKEESDENTDDEKPLTRRRSSRGVKTEEPDEDEKPQIRRRSTRIKTEEPSEEEENSDAAFWSGKTTSCQCPQCNQLIGQCAVTRQTHYRRYHYSIFYNHAPNMCDVERWVSLRIGGPADEARGGFRVCHHCPVDKDNKYDGRVGLLRHMKKEHAQEFRNLKENYRLYSRSRKKSLTREMIEVDRILY